MSTNDFLVNITTSNKGLRFSVTATNPPLHDKAFVRPNSSLADAIIDALRSGNANPDTVLEAIEHVTTWLFSSPPDALFDSLSRALESPSPVRLIFRLEDELRSELGKLPVELIRTGGGQLLFRERLQSIVHLIPYDGPPQTTLADLNYPLRVLIVRSNPTDLGGAVPPAGPIRDQIVGLGEQYFGQGQIVVDLLSSEVNPHVVDRPTWDQFQKQVGRNYHLLVYLGHGDLKFEALPPTGVLQFEDPWGRGAVPVGPDQLKLSLQGHPVPVVLLVGCLTAAEFQSNYLNGFPEKQRKALLNWVMGSQGVAQALVESDSGVQLAVGMRYKLDTDHARQFLVGFFAGLLGPENRGNVEAAVRSGRQRVYQDFPDVPGWSAPVVYRNLDRSNASLGTEPMFSFLLTTPVTEDADDRAAREIRLRSWERLSKTSLSQRSADDLSFPREILQVMENRLSQKYGHRGAVLSVDYMGDAEPGKKMIVSIRLRGQPVIQELAGKITIDGPAAQDVWIQLAPEWKKAYTIANLENYGFQLKRTGSSATPLADGPMLEVKLTTGDLRSVFYRIGITLSPEPAHPLIWCLENAVVVPAA
jgi:hypothetical protein